MSTIFYGVCGEGRGHAARVRTVVEELRPRHTVHIFAPAMAYEMLAPIYRETAVHVHRTPGLCFAYGERHQVDYLKTGWQAMKYLAELHGRIHRVAKAIEKYTPDLVITDFEPIEKPITSRGCRTECSATDPCRIRSVWRSVRICVFIPMAGSPSVSSTPKP